MNLLSCEKCGVVFDVNRIPEPDIYDEDGNPSIFGIWDNDIEDFAATIECPVCRSRISYTTGDAIY